MSWPLSPRVELGTTIKAVDAARQRETAAAILKRFERLPGIVLADEVGMGKTFVALAVAVSAIEATDGRAPVVVMVPPAVRDKWPREWRKFHAALRPGREIRAAEPVTSASDFLKLLDDPPERRAQLVFLTHGALHNALADPYVKLAIVRRALSAPRLARQRAALPRWASALIPSLRLDADAYATLLAAPPSRWRRELRRLTGTDPGDDPVPRAVLNALSAVNLTPLRDVLEERMPLRAGPTIEARLHSVRQSLAHEVATIWKACMTRLELDLPLLILEEAHHAKNPWTRLARLFENEDATALQRGAFGGVFERMLFLTATPFQLGHDELIEVLRRFTGVRWDDLDRDAYERELEELKRALDRMQASALRLDRAWGRLGADELAEALPDRWWSRPDDASLPDALRAVAATWVETRERTRRAEVALRPHVIRHLRPDRDERRATLCGQAIIDDVSADRGLGVDGPAVLPFLLAARAQAVVALHGVQEHRRTRALFADGLASSFEAYRRTRTARDAAELLDDAGDGATDELPAEVAWYLDRIERALPADGDAGFLEHPKVAATVRRTVALWKAREKAVIFCFFKATGRALRSHVARAIEAETVALAAAPMRLDARASEEVLRRLDGFRERLFDPRSPARRFAEGELRALLREQLAGDELELAAELALRFLRTRSFLVRYADLAAAPLRAMEAAFARTDGSGMAFADVVRAFGRFVATREASERARYLDVLGEIAVGDIGVRDLEEGAGDGRAANVRLVNGEVDHAVRERVTLAFNTPFFPEVLIASAVMAEGVDLHRHCRHAIHHDLDWNPSVIEQRTGRLDRIESKAEATRQRVVVYEPFVEGAQDEKQFRVMKDRERWFNVVMGERLTLDEWATDRLAERVELPDEAARELGMELGVGGRARRPPDPR